MGANRQVKSDVEHVMDAVWNLIRRGPNFDGQQKDVENAIEAAIKRAVSAERDCRLCANFTARYAAAELVLKADERFEAMEDLRNEVKRCFDIAQALDMMNPTLAGTFTGLPSERIQRQLDAMSETL